MKVDLVFTYGSVYWVNQEEHWVLRSPGAPLDDNYKVASLRMDGERIHIREVLNMREGEAMVLLLQIEEDLDVATLRITSPVLEIVKEVEVETT